MERGGRVASFPALGTWGRGEESFDGTLDGGDRYSTLFFLRVTVVGKCLEEGGTFLAGLGRDE